MESFVFTLSSGEDQKKICQSLEAASSYDFDVTRGDVIDGCILDTFENEIRVSGRFLLQTEHSLLLINFLSGEIVEQTASDWSFVTELKKGPVARSLEKVSKLRAFIPGVIIKIQRDRMLVLDDEEKTRVRLYLFSFYRKKKSMQLGVTQSLRGYEPAHGDLKNLLLDLGAVSCSKATDIYKRLGIKSKNYSAKPDIALIPEDPIKISITTIIRTYIDVARQNETGMVEDYDTEFLHDFRVSFRKVRSVLSLFKRVYGSEQTEQLKQEFADLMKQTNRLRDLDVYLLDRDYYFRLIPESSYEGLKIMFDIIAATREEEHKKVCKMIKRKSYRQSLKGWVELFGNADSMKTGPDALKGSNSYLSRLISRRYRKVCKIARDIDGTTADEVVHELRIHCKKLRYLMEFALPLFSKKKIKSLIKSLKVLQENLGKFNDYSLQQLSLGMFMSEHALSGTKGMKVAESTGALTAMLYQLQCRERNLVMENFSRFDSEKTRASFAELFQVEDC